MTLFSPNDYYFNVFKRNDYNALVYCLQNIKTIFNQQCLALNIMVKYYDNYFFKNDFEYDKNKLKNNEEKFYFLYALFTGEYNNKKTTMVEIGKNIKEDVIQDLNNIEKNKILNSETAPIEEQKFIELMKYDINSQLTIELNNHKNHYIIEKENKTNTIKKTNLFLQNLIIQ